MVRRYTLFVLIAFLLNFVWESWHAVYLYHSGFGFDFVSSTGPLRGFVRLMTYVSLMDALLLTVILLGGAVLWRTQAWFVRMDSGKYAYFIVVALFVAAVIEYKAVFLFHQWSYSELMPTLFGVGLSPLLQLAVTGLASLWGMRRYTA